MNPRADGISRTGQRVGRCLRCAPLIILIFRLESVLLLLLATLHGGSSLGVHSSLQFPSLSAFMLVLVRVHAQIDGCGCLFTISTESPRWLMKKGRYDQVSEHQSLCVTDRLTLCPSGLSLPCSAPSPRAPSREGPILHSRSAQ